MGHCTRELLSAQVLEQGMEEHDGLVHAFIQRQGGGDISYDEALQAGRIGLWHALRGYDATRGTRFSSYAWVVIGRQIRRRVQELSRERAASVAAPTERRDEPDPVADIDTERVHSALLGLVSQLPERLRQVIVGRYGLGEPGPCTLAAVGQALGVTGERVRQLEQDALAWLRHPAHSWRLRSLVGRDRAQDYRRALAQNAALRRARRQAR